MDKNTLEYLKFFTNSIKSIHVLTEEMYEQMQEARRQIVDKYDIDCYELIESLSTTVAKVCGKLDFLDDAFARFTEDLMEESEGSNVIRNL